MGNWILAFDFGGTKLTAALLAAAALVEVVPTWTAHKRAFSPAAGDAQYDIQTMIRLGHDLLAAHNLTVDALAAVGVSFGGPVDYATGIVRLSHHVPGWDNIPLQILLETEFGVPIRVDNDANVAALGEWRFGTGRDVNDLFYITISTGVGGGWVLNGRSWRGCVGMAGEIGHMTVDPQGPLCLCGKRGCVERLASGPYMAQDYKEAKGKEELSAIQYVALDAAITGETVAKLAAQGDETALHILRRGAWALGVGIGNAANLINPQLFVLGGGVTKSGILWWNEVQQAARATALPEVPITIVPAAFPDDAPLWGAVALVEALI